MGSQCCKCANGDKQRGSISSTNAYRFRGDLLMPSDRYEIHTRGNVVQLTLKESQKDDEGHYALVAKKLSTDLSIPGDERLESRRKIRLSIQDPSQSSDEGEPPIFIRRLSDLAVKVGTRTRFLVEIRSSMSPKITWHKNDEHLQSGSRFSFVHEGNFYCVDVAPVMVDDQGHWTCMAENGGGRSSCTSFLNVIVPKAYKKPEFVDELRAILTETGTVSLECKVVGVPTPVLKWFKDQREIKAGDVFALTANPDDPTSLGTYTCEAVNCMGAACSSSKVHVMGKGSREGSLKPADTLTPSGPLPVFKRILRNETCGIGDLLTLSCQVTVPPWPKSIVWYNKEGTVEPSEKYNIFEDGLGGYSIEIKCVEAMDEGEWKCVATSSDNMKQFSTCYVAMSIPKNYRSPRFMESLKAILTDEGLVSFECKVVGFPTPLLRWFKDGQELHPGDVYQLTGTNSLGFYCCIARNCMGEAKSTAELTVEDIQNQLNEEERLLLMSSNQAPRFAKGLRSCEARINDDFTFTIQVSVSPEPNLSWYRDDVPIIESEKYQLAREALGDCRLEVRKLEFIDQAEWKCVAANDFGHSVTSCFLKLVIPKHFKKPKFLESLRAILSEEGAVNLECKVIGVPQPVLKWYKDGVQLKPGDIHRIISGQDGTCCLGTYTCEATNCMGSVSSSASLLGFEDRVSVGKEEAKEPLPLHELARNLSLSTIHEERTSQLYDTPQTDHSITLDDRGELSFSFDGKEVSVSLYETPDLTEEEALQIVEMYADQLSEHITEGNIIELPPMRFTKETSTTGNLLMEAVIIDVSPNYFIPDEEADDLRTEADVEDVSIMDDRIQSIRSSSYVSSPVAESLGDQVPSGSPPSRPPRRKESRESASSRSERSEKSLLKGFDWSESYHSAKEPSIHVQYSLQGQNDSGEAFTDALSSSGAGRSMADEPEELLAAFVEQTIENVFVDEINDGEIIEMLIEECSVEEVPVKRKKKKKSKQVTEGSRTPSISSTESSEESYAVEPQKKVNRQASQNGEKNGNRRGRVRSNKSDDKNKSRKSRSPSQSGKIESAAGSWPQNRESEATIIVEDDRIEQTDNTCDMTAAIKTEIVHTEHSKAIVDDRPASATSVASTIDSGKSMSKTNKEILLGHVYKLSESIMSLRSALVDLDTLLPFLRTDGSQTDIERSQMEIIQRIVASVENLCEQVSAIENKALKSADDRSLAQNVRISLLEAIGGPTEELLHAIELLRRYSEQLHDPKAHLIVMDSLTDPVDEICVGLTRIEHELESRESYETSAVGLEKPIALERMCQAVSRLGTTVANITGQRLTFGDESTSCLVLERLQSIHQSLQAFLSTVPLSDVSGVLINNVDTLVVESLVRPLEELTNNLYTLNTTGAQGQGERQCIVANLEKSMSEMRTRLEALIIAMETYEKEFGEQGITELHADLIEFLRYTIDDAVESLQKSNMKQTPGTQKWRTEETGAHTLKIFDGKSKQDGYKEELAMQSSVESLEGKQSGVLRSLAEEAAAIINITAISSIVEAKTDETEKRVMQEKPKVPKTVKKPSTADDDKPTLKKDRKKKPKKPNSSETCDGAFLSPKIPCQLPPELDPDLSLPEMLLDPLIDVQANLSDVIIDFESQDSAEESSLPGTCELATCLTELRECVATAVHTATTLNSVNTVNALVDLREPLLDLQLAMASAVSPEEVKLIRKATIPLAELKLIIATAIASPLTSETSQIQMKPVFRMLEDIEAEVIKVYKQEATTLAPAGSSIMPEATEIKSIPKRPPEEVERAAVALTGVHFAFSTALDRGTTFEGENMGTSIFSRQQENRATARELAEQSAASNLLTSIEELRQCVGSLAVAIGSPVASIDSSDQYSYDILFDELAKLEKPLLNLQKVLLTEIHGPEDRHVLNDVASPIRSLKEIVQYMTQGIGRGSTPIVLELIEDVEKDVSLIAMEALKKALARESITLDDDKMASVSSNFQPGEVSGIISKWLYPIENWLTSTSDEVGDIDKEQTESSIASVVDYVKRKLLRISIQSTYSEPPSDIALIECLTELQEPLAKICEVLAECHEPESLDIVEGLIQPTKHLLGTILDASMTHEAGNVLHPVLETTEELENQIRLTIKRATYERELQRVVKSITPPEPDTLMTDDIAETLEKASPSMRIIASVEVHENSGISSKKMAAVTSKVDVKLVERDQPLASKKCSAVQATEKRSKTDESTDEEIEAAEITVRGKKSEEKVKSLTEIDAANSGMEVAEIVESVEQVKAISVAKTEEKLKEKLEPVSEKVIAPNQIFSSKASTTLQEEKESIVIIQKYEQDLAGVVDGKVNKENVKLSQQVATADTQLEETRDENDPTFTRENPALAQATSNASNTEQSQKQAERTKVTVERDQSNECPANVVRSNSIEVITVDGRPFIEEVTALDPQQATKTALEETSRAEQLDSWTLTLLGPLSRLGDAVLSLNRSLDDEAHVLMCRPLNSLHKQIEIAVSQFNRLAGQSLENDVETIIEGFLSPINRLHSALCRAVEVWDVEKPRPVVEELLRAFMDSSTELCELLDALRNKLYLQFRRLAQSRQQEQEDASLVETITAVLTPLDNLRSLIETTLKSKKFMDLAQKAMEILVSEDRGHNVVESTDTEQGIYPEEEKIKEGEDSVARSLEQTAQSRAQNELLEASFSQVDTIAAAMKCELDSEIALEDDGKLTKRATVGEVKNLSVQEKATSSKADATKGLRRGSRGMEESMDIEEKTAKPLKELIEAIVDSSGPRHNPSPMEGYKSITPDISDHNLDKTELLAFEENNAGNKNVKIVGLTEIISTEDILGENVKEAQKDQLKEHKANILTKGTLAKAETATSDKVSLDIQQRLAETVSIYNLTVKNVEGISVAEQKENKAERYNVDCYARSEQIEVAVIADDAHLLVIDNIIDNINKSKETQAAGKSQMVVELPTLNTEKNPAKVEGGKEKNPVLGSSEVSRENIAAEVVKDIVTKELDKQNAELRDSRRIAKVSENDVLKIMSKADYPGVIETPKLLEKNVQLMPAKRSKNRTVELREGDYLVAAQIKYGLEMRVDATVDQIPRAQEGPQENVQDLNAENIQLQIQPCEDQDQAIDSAVDPSRSKTRIRDSEISEAPGRFEKCDEISTAKLDEQTAKLHEAKNPVTTGLTEGPGTKIELKTAQMTKISEMPEESVRKMRKNELNEQNAEIRQEEKDTTANFTERLHEKVRPIKKSERETHLSTTMQYPEERFDEMVEKDVNKEKSTISDSDSLTKVGIADVPKSNIKARVSHPSEQSTIPQENIKGVTEQQFQAEEAIVPVMEHQSAHILKIEATEVGKYTKEEVIDSAGSAIVKMIETPTQTNFIVRKEEPHSGEPDSSLEKVSVKPIAEFVATEGQQIIDIAETPAEKVIKTKLAVEAPNRGVEEAIGESVIKEPVGGLTKTLGEEERQAISISVERLRELVLERGSSRDLGDLPKAKQQQSVDEDFEDSSEKDTNADTNEEHDDSQKQDDKAIPKTEDQGAEGRREKKTDKSKHEKQGHQEADRLKRAESENVKEDDHEKSRKTEHAKMEMDTIDLLEYVKQEIEFLASGDGERCKYNTAERFKGEKADRRERDELERVERERTEIFECEDAKRLEQEEAERVKHEEAERLKREEAQRLEREEAERVEREEAAHLEREKVERLERAEMECLEPEGAERLEREDLDRLEREETKRVKRVEEKQLRKEEVKRLEKEEFDHQVNAREEAERLKLEKMERQNEEREKILLKEAAKKHKKEEQKCQQELEVHTLKLEERELQQKLEVEQLRKAEERVRKEEAEGLKREEGEHHEKLENERLKKEEIEQLQKEESEKLTKQERDWQEKARQKAEQLKKAELKRMELKNERLNQKELERAKKEEGESPKNGEAERFNREDLKRIEKEEEELSKKEKAERLEEEEIECTKKKAEERPEKGKFAQLEQEKLERARREEEERLKKEEAERSRQEELGRLRIEAEKRQKKEEGERLKKEERERIEKDEEEHLKKEKVEKLKQQEIECTKKKAEERVEKDKFAQLELEKLEHARREEKERLKKKEAEHSNQEELDRLKIEEEGQKEEEAERLNKEEFERAGKEEEYCLKKKQAERLEQEELECAQKKVDKRLKKEEAAKLEQIQLENDKAAKLEKTKPEKEEAARLETEALNKKETPKLEKAKLEKEKEKAERLEKEGRKRAENKEVERLNKEEGNCPKDKTGKLQKKRLQRESKEAIRKTKDVAGKLKENEEEQARGEAEKTADKETIPQPKEAEDDLLKKKELKRQQKDESKLLKTDDSNSETKTIFEKSDKEEIVSGKPQDTKQAASLPKPHDSDEKKKPMNSDHDIADSINKSHVRVLEDIAFNREPRSTSTIWTGYEIESADSKSAKSAMSRDGAAQSGRRRSGQDMAMEVDYDASNERSGRRGSDRLVLNPMRDDTLSSNGRHYTPYYAAISRIRESGPGPKDRGKKPFFCTKLTERTAAETSRIKLICTVLGEPEPQVYWTKNGVKLPNSSNRHSAREDNGMVTLEFYAASPKDSGEYSCVAKNLHGQAHTEAKLKVYAGYEPAPAVPTFTRPIKDTYRSAENELLLECRVRGQPSPTITWLKDGQVLEIGDRYRQCDLGDGLCHLKILSPDFYDSGLYTCKAENASKISDRTSHVVNFEAEGKKQSWRGSYRNVTNTDIETGQPRFSSYLTDHSVPTGGTIALQVEVKGVPPPDITCMRGDKREALPSHKVRNFADSGIYSLIVPEAAESETGTYVCRASNAYGYVDTTATVQVVSSDSIEGGKPAMFISRPAETTIHVTVGEDVSVSFRLNGAPKPRIVWMKGTRDISNGPRSYKESIDDYVRLTLKRALVSDEGTYCILAKNRYGCDRTFYTVKVKQRARSLTPSPDWGSVDTDNLLANIHAIERSYLNQVPGPIASEPVVVDGGRNWLALTWGKAVQHGLAPVVAYRVDGWLLGGEGGARWSELGITPVNAYDAFNLRPGGEYKFRITPRNRYGWGETVIMTNSVTVCEVDKFPEFSKVLPGQLKALRGETLHLECEVRSESKSKIKWYRDTTDIETIGDLRYMTYFNGCKSSLTVQAINKRDSGRFVCEAINAAGRVSTFARVQVVTDSRIVEADEKLRRMRTLELNNAERPPEFTMRLRDRRVQMTYPVRLTCQVSGKPEPEVTWYKNREEISQDENTSFWDDDSRFHTLEISHSTLDDCGIYMATARNVNGMVSCRCQLVVDKGIRAYVAPEFSRHLDAAYTIKAGGELRMSAQIEAYPTVGIVWHRDGQRLRLSRNAVMTLNHDGSIELSLAYVTPRDAGLYCCTATNESGQAESSTRVNVLGATDEEPASVSQFLPNVVESLDVPYSKEPVFVTKPLSTEAVEGDTVIILCQVVGDPKPEVIWLRDFLRPDYYRDAAHFRRIGAGPQYRLEIPYAKLDFTGAYSVIAKNCHGEVKAIISLQIYARGQGEIDSSMEQATIKHGNVQTLPSIKRPLRDLRCCDGDAVTLICRVDATPEPDVRWEKGGKLVPLGDDFAADFDGETARLSIQHVYPEDEGEYTCVAYNDLGRAFTSACLIVDVPEGQESALSRTLARPIGLLSAESKPKSTPRSTPIRSLSPSCVTSRRELKLGGRTSCGQTISRRSRLPVGPKFYAVPHNRVAEEGETVRFQCAVAGHPTPWISWDKDGVSVTPTARISVKEKDDVRILEIVEITHEDAGLYRITLVNDIGRTEATARLEVIKGRHSSVTRSIRTRSASPRTYSIYSRSPITSAVRSDTHHRPDIYDAMGGHGGTPSPTPPRWSQRNGKQHVDSPEPMRRIHKRNTTPAQTLLKNGIATQTKTQNYRVSVFTRPRSTSVPKQNPSPKDVHAYPTNARQTKTSNENSATATKKTTTNGSMTSTRLPISRSRLSKIFTNHSNSSSKKVEDSVDSYESMTVTVPVIDGSKPPKAAGKSEIQRFFRGNSEIQRTCDEESPELKIPPFVESVPPLPKSPEIQEDRPRSMGEDTKERRAPIILAAPADTVALQGTKVLLLATFESQPQPRVRWLRKGRDVKLDDKTEIETSRGLTCLTLKAVTTEQAGKYAITLENAAGRACRYVNVAVEDVPDPPAGEPCVQSITRAGKAIVTWRSPPYDGGCAVTGYSVEMKRSEEFCWITVAEARHSLSHTVTGLEPEETYRFRVRAENAHGVSAPGIVSEAVTVPGENDVEFGGQVFVAEINEIEIDEEDEEFAPTFEARIVSTEEGDKFEARYDVWEELGKGRYGIVRRIVEKSSCLNLAAKFVRTIKSKDRQQVYEEIGIMNTLRHPKLLRLAAAFESPKEMIMVTEYISGGELFERVVADDFTLTEKDCIQFVKQICEGVEYMHAHSVVHLDLKPENIMCHTRTSHRIKLIDFGLAQTLKPDTPVRVLLGTPEFIPPEIIGFEPIGTESDMWSVGVICYVLLTGLSPFMGDNDAETFANITRADYDFDDKAFTAISQEAKDFISALLVKRKEIRMSAKRCLEHAWLVQRAESMSRVALPTDKLKKFIVRRKWQKTGNAIRALGRMATLSANSRRNLSADSSPTKSKLGDESIADVIPNAHGFKPIQPNVVIADRTKGECSEKLRKIADKQKELTETKQDEFIRTNEELSETESQSIAEHRPILENYSNSFHCTENRPTGTVLEIQSKQIKLEDSLPLIQEIDDLIQIDENEKSSNSVTEVLIEELPKEIYTDTDVSTDFDVDIISSSYSNETTRKLSFSSFVNLRIDETGIIDVSQNGEEPHGILQTEKLEQNGSDKSKDAENGSIEVLQTTELNEILQMEKFEESDKNELNDEGNDTMEVLLSSQLDGSFRIEKFMENGHNELKDGGHTMLEVAQSTEPEESFIMDTFKENANNEFKEGEDCTIGVSQTVELDESLRTEKFTANDNSESKNGEIGFIEVPQSAQPVESIRMEKFEEQDSDELKSRGNGIIEQSIRMEKFEESADDESKDEENTVESRKEAAAFDNEDIMNEHDCIESTEKNPVIDKPWCKNNNPTLVDEEDEDARLIGRVRASHIVCTGSVSRTAKMFEKEKETNSLSQRQQNPFVRTMATASEPQIPRPQNERIRSAFEFWNQ